MGNDSLPLIGSIVSGYERLMAAGDPRVEQLFLMQSPIPITTICLVYIYFVLSLGPRLMADRKPYNLRNILMFYNMAQTILSAVLFFLGIRHWISCFGWGLSCRSVDYTLRTPEEMLTIRLCHVYFLSKITELADTVFFVLKKKHNHISLLHVFHHAAMPFSVWFGVKYHPGGNLAFFGLPNLFVHTWMYLYYFLAALGPEYQRYIWWKRLITQMQLAQFIIVMMYMLFVAIKCDVNKTLLLWTILMDIAFVILFADFYWKTYVKKKGSNRTAVPYEIRDREESKQKSTSVRVDSPCERKNGYPRLKENSEKKDL